MSERVLPRVLAIDTTAEFGSIALLEDRDGESRVIEEVLLHSADGFAHVLFDQIERLLERHRIGLGDIDAFAAAAGPGSFTGVRVGLAAAKGLAEGTGKKAIAVSNLQAMASFGTAPLRAVVLDARRGEVYGAVYDARLRAVGEEVVMKFPAWLATLPQSDLEIISNGFPMTDAPPGARITISPRGLAGAIGQIALQRLRDGLVLDPTEIDANYVRRSDAELLWKEPPGS